MARRAGLWALGGATAATGMLVSSPEAYAWLRRKAGLDQPELLDEAAPAHDDAVDSTFDTREARLSLRARLHESEQESDPQPSASADERPLAARPRPKREDVEPMRRAVDEARTRMLDNARRATKENGPAA
jgi:hypothetical protein